jgi:Trk K+ transport system NAD-binding subunit
MSGHFVVCGMGDIGFRVVELLHRLGEKVVAVTDRALEERKQSAEAMGVRVILGDARNERHLLEAGLLEAQCVIAATDQDLVNIEIALDTHRFRPELPVVVRLFDQDLARQLETALDIRRALGMSALAAPSFAAAAMGDAILASFPLDNVPFVVGRRLVVEGPLLGCDTVGALARRHKLHSLVIEREGGTCIPLPLRDEALRPGDRLSLFGRRADWERLFGAPDELIPRGEKVPWLRRLRRRLTRAWTIWREEPLALRAVFVSLCLLIPLTVFLFHYYLRLPLTDAIFFTITNLHGDIGLTQTTPEIKLYEVLVMIMGSITVATLYSMITDYLVGSRLRKLLGGRPMPKKGQVVVVGMGNVGFRVVHELQQVGVPVVAVEADPDAPFLATVRGLAPVVLGDARLNETLERAGLARARAVVAATSDDSVNLGIGLAARRMNPRVRTVVRQFDAEFARKVERALGIDAALGASRIAAPTFAASALFPDVAQAFIVQDRLIVALRRPVGSEWAGYRPAELREEKAVHILLRSGELTPAGLAASDETPLGADEEVLAFLWRKLAPPWSEQMSSPGA